MRVVDSSECDARWLLTYQKNSFPLQLDALAMALLGLSSRHWTSEVILRQRCTPLLLSWCLDILEVGSATSPHATLCCAH